MKLSELAFFLGLLLFAAVVIGIVYVLLAPGAHALLDATHKVVVNTQTTTNTPATVDSMLNALKSFGGK